ncbi:unnamed protein product [Parnassius apollo]|uniref:(apollo) hypothetical protein n=1 Tax=Parnassius apollo TaxID=110799 RepID=A0A8S3Y5S9_PARAO|nr:unnamed protein product [Parnassius apollo]
MASFETVVHHQAKPVCLRRAAPLTSSAVKVHWQLTFQVLEKSDFCKPTVAVTVVPFSTPVIFGNVGGREPIPGEPFPGKTGICRLTSPSARKGDSAHDAGDKAWHVLSKCSGESAANSPY